MRFEAYKYTGNKPRIFETWVNAENINLHQNKKNNGHTVFSRVLSYMWESVHMHTYPSACTKAGNKTYVESFWANTWMLWMWLKILLCCIYSLFYSFMPKIGYLSYNGPGYSILWSDMRINSKRTGKKVLVPETYRSRERVELSSHNQSWCSSS